MEIEITEYDSWMEEQVCQLFVMNYGVEFDAFQLFFNHFYEASYQEKNCIRLVALEGKTVVGFQSFFYWPFHQGEKVIRAYQSGNSLVHPDHRGKGVFGKLLKRGDVALAEKKAELIIGFPIDASLGSFVRAGWKNDINLQWYVKPLSPVKAVLPQKLPAELDAVHGPKPVPCYPDNALLSSSDPEFFEWRKGYHPFKYYFVNEKQDGEELLLILKTSKRMKVLNELVIGEVYCSTREPQMLEKLSKGAMKQIRKRFNGFAFVSFACSEHSQDPLDLAIMKQGFRKIDKQVYFVYKPFGEGVEIPNPDQWRLYRGDIDTW